MSEDNKIEVELYDIYIDEYDGAIMKSDEVEGGSYEYISHLLNKSDFDCHIEKNCIGKNEPHFGKCKITIEQLKGDD